MEDHPKGGMGRRPEGDNPGCKCGCGEPVRWKCGIWNRFTFGHGRRKWRKSGEVSVSDAKRDEYTWRKYGLTPEDYAAMAEAQGNRCAICETSDLGGHAPKKPRDRWCIDHCHRTDKVRGLLCASCNGALGHLKDDTTIVAKALAYLKEHE